MEFIPTGKFYVVLNISEFFCKKMEFFVCYLDDPPIQAEVVCVFFPKCLDFFSN